MSSYTSALLAAYMPARLAPFMTVSYPAWGTENGHRVLLYRKGRNDIHFVIFMTIMFAVVRHFVMTYILSPFAHRFVRVDEPPITPGVDKATKERRLRIIARRKEHAASRFAEQGWSMMYCLVTESIGLVSVKPSGMEAWWTERGCVRVGTCRVQHGRGSAIRLPRPLTRAKWHERVEGSFPLPTQPPGRSSATASNPALHAFAYTLLDPSLLMWLRANTFS